MVPMPVALIRLVATASEKVRLPFPVATDQLRQLKHDNIGPLASVVDGFGFEPRPMEGGLTHLRQRLKDQEPASALTSRQFERGSRPRPATLRLVSILRTVATRIAWVTLASLIALGSAGIVATMNPMPATAARPELTWAGDAEMQPALDAATRQLEALSAEVDTLGATARVALSQVVAGDAEGLRTTISTGTLRVAGVQGLSSDLERSLAAVPHTGEDWALHVSTGMRHRFDELASTAGVTKGVGDDWAALTGRSIDATQVSALLTSHDEQTAAAAKLGSEGKFKGALAQLDASDATIADSRALADRLAATTDVSTLKAWIDRNANYDAALRVLYQALVKSGARVNGDVRKALDLEQQARAQLPGDTRALVVIMSDIARGGLNQAVIAIEEARGSLSQALEVQQQLRVGPAIEPPG